MALVDRFQLYELCVQSPAAQAAFLRAVHGAAPLALREDFCARAAIARAWLELDERATAVAVDFDRRVHGEEFHPRLERRVADVTQPSGDESCYDVIHAGNFSLGYLETRAALLGYLRLTRARLRPGGLLFADTFGGASAFRLGASERQRFLPDGRRVRCLWRRVEADPARGSVVNTLSFCVDRDGEIELELPDAFEYRWRLWSLPELREACLEVGLLGFELYEQLDSARPAPVDGARLGADFSVGFVVRAPVSE